MREPKGPPCGFLGLGLAAGTSAADGTIGDRQDFDLVSPPIVERPGFVGGMSDGPIPRQDQSLAGTENALKRHNSRDKEKRAIQSWSAEIWAQIELDVPPPEPFAILSSKKKENKVLLKEPVSKDDPDPPFDEREGSKFFGQSPEADQPDFKGIGEAFLSMCRRETDLKKNNRDWENYSKSQIAALGEEYPTGGRITIEFNNKISFVRFKLKEDPEEVINSFFDKIGVRKIKQKDFDHVLNIVETHLENDRKTPGSPYYKLRRFKRDLDLRKLRNEIVSGRSNKWDFVLQKIPPTELKPSTTHCAHPYCRYHVSGLMPAGGYRLVFTSDHQPDQQPHWFHEVCEGDRTPGRTRDGQILFCLACIENLFNGDGLIKIDKQSAGSSNAAQAQPPSIKPRRMARGLDSFATNLHDCIRPELRYTSHEFYTLNSFEYHAFMKWKNMVMRKMMWEIPRNRAFNLQIPESASRYDIVDFFGDDCLDMDQPRPSIVVGIPLNMEEVCANDISITKHREPVNADVDKKVIGVESQAPDQLSESEQTPRESIVERQVGEKYRIVKPLSEIMDLVDRRVRKAWAAMNPPYVPCNSRKVPAPSDREWPPPAIWETEIRTDGEREHEGVMNSQKELDHNNSAIIHLPKAGGLESQPHTSRSKSKREAVDMRIESKPDSSNLVNRRRAIDKCLTCGTTESPDWRRGPKGPRTLCNACGLRYFREGHRKQRPEAGSK